MSCTKLRNEFWLDNPLVLLSNTNLIPSSNLTLNENLNALTRVLLLVTAFMYFNKNKNWLNVLLGGVIGIVAIKLINASKIEGYHSNYEYAKFETPVTPLVPFYAEEWQSPPPMYDVYTNAYNPSEDTTNLDVDCDNTPKAFGQYITNPRSLPYQAQEIGNKGLDASKLYMNVEFTNDTMRYRSSMISNYMNTINSWYRGGGYDQISPYEGY